MPLCHAAKACKEVVIPDKNGNPIGGLTCSSFCNNVKLPPGYEWWTAVDGATDALASAPPGTVRLLDTDTGDIVQLTFAECRAVMRAYRMAGGR